MVAHKVEETNLLEGFGEPSMGTGLNLNQGGHNSHDLMMDLGGLGGNSTPNLSQPTFDLI